MTEQGLDKSINQRIPELDGLRGIAILLVVSFHYVNNQLINTGNFIGKILSKLTYFGWVGVDFFFVLSGFLIGSILIKNRNSTNYFSTFYFRRLMRIVPNYYLLICLFILILNIPFFAKNTFLTGNNILPAWSYFMMVHNFFMGSLNNMGNDSISVTWSIGIEEQFYILFPLIVFFLKGKWLPYVLVIFIISASIIRLQFSSWIPAYVLLPCRMDAISLGALLAYYNQQYNLNDIVRKHFIFFVIVLVMDVAICGIFYTVYDDLGSVKHTLFVVFFTIGILFALTKKQSWYGYLLRNKLLIWVGTISYSLYLFHYMILGLFHQIVSNKIGLGINNSKDIMVTLLALFSAILFSWGIYKLMELPLVNWGKKIKY
ncbi:MAG: acyltransferase [Bacteroidota bacterium]